MLELRGTILLFLLWCTSYSKAVSTVYFDSKNGTGTEISATNNDDDDIVDALLLLLGVASAGVVLLLLDVEGTGVVVVVLDVESAGVVVVLDELAAAVVVLVDVVGATHFLRHASPRGPSTHTSLTSASR